MTEGPLLWRMLLRHMLPAMVLALALSACDGSDPTSPGDPEPDPVPDPGSDPLLVIFEAPGAVDGQGFAVSDEGFAVGWFLDEESSQALPVRWRWDGEYEALAPMSVTSGWATDITPDGRTVIGVASVDGGPLDAFRWTEGDGFDNLGGFGGVAAVDASRMSTDGTVMTGAAQMADDYVYPIVWREDGTIDTLGILPDGDRALATSVTADGSVVAGMSRVIAGVNQWRAFRWTAGEGMVQLPGLVEDGWARADEISGDGQRIVGSARIQTNASLAVVWEGTNDPVLLPEVSPDLPRSWARSISGDGSIIVGSAWPDALQVPSHAVRWTAEGAEDLNETWADLVPEGWVLRNAMAVSSNGKWIAGDADNGEARRAFLLFTGD